MGLPYIQAGYGFLLVEYPGYSSQPGEPTEASLYATGRAFIQGLAAAGIPAGRLVLMGYSLGTGIATELATEFPVGGLVLMAPFLSMGDMAQQRFPYFPAKLLVRDRYDNQRKIAEVHAPLLITNGGEDEVIPPVQGRTLFALANEPKQFFFAPEAGHNTLFDSGFVPVSLAWLGELHP